MLGCKTDGPKATFSDEPQFSWEINQLCCRSLMADKESEVAVKKDLLCREFAIVDSFSDC
jgi:hypothetical protein